MINSVVAITACVVSVVVGWHLHWLFDCVRDHRRFLREYGSIEAKVPIGLLRAEDTDLTEQQAAEIIERWRERFGEIKRCTVILPRKPQRPWWKRLRARKGRP